MTTKLIKIQIKEQFFEELQAVERDWEKNGGIPLDDIKNKYIEKIQKKFRNF